MVEDHKKIAIRYVTSMSFWIDCLSTFPFEIFDKYLIWIRLLRLLRLPQFISMIDLSKVNQVITSFFANKNRKERIMIQYLLVYSYKIFRLIIIAIVVTYFTGCFWFLFGRRANSDADMASEDGTFNLANGVDMNNPDVSDYDRMILSCYFALTTLSTVGYGDMNPKSTNEMIFGIGIMLCGVAFFSFIMGSFIEIISNFNQQTGTKDEGTDLHQWLSLLTRFTNNRPLPKRLINQIDEHFQFYWSNDRLSSISKDNEFLNALPRSIKRNIMITYLFEDVFDKFRFFFNTQKYKDSKFLYDISFGIKPRCFSHETSQRLIYDEEDEVSEMYFIMGGTVGIGYYLFSQGLSKEQIKIGIFMKENTFICDYNVCNNKKNEFVILAVQEVKAFALSKKFLVGKIFHKYPEIGQEIKEQSFYRYTKNVRQRLVKHRNEHIEEINKKNSYKTIQLRQKDAGNEGNRSKLSDIKGNKDDNDVGSILKKRIEGINDEMGKFNKNINEFTQTCDTELNDMVGNINLLARNIGYIQNQTSQALTTIQDVSQGRPVRK
jgi:potassium voltage-gated channel Eag-related subfamily H protein 8